MASKLILSAVTFNPASDVKYAGQNAKLPGGKPKLNKSGGKSLSLFNSKTSKSLYLSTPLMLTWGVNEYVDETTGKKTYNMALQFPREDYVTEETTKFLENIKSLEDKIKTDAVKNSKEWLNKSKTTPEVVDALFHPMLNYPKDEHGEPDPTRSPTLRVKLDYWDEKFTCEIYDLQRQMLFPNEDGHMPMDFIPKSSNVAVVIRCGGLWFANGKFGCTWKLEQAVVKPRESLRGTCHVLLSEEDKQRLDAQKVDDDDSDNETSNTTAVQDSDDEQSEFTEALLNEVKEELTEAPKKKKVVRKKKKAGAESSE